MTTLEEITTEFGHITIVRSDEDGTITYYEDNCRQSQVNDEGVCTHAYVHVLFSILKQSGSKRVLMIGCAGGTLASMLHAANCKVTVVDINPHSFALARKYFDMPDAIECVVADGVEFLDKTQERFDAIVVDAFVGNVTVPDSFTTDTFFTALKQALRPNGLVLMNVVVADDNDMTAEIIGLNMEIADIRTTLFDWPGRSDRNTILVGGSADHIQIKPYTMPKFLRSKVEGVERREPNRYSA